MSPAVRRNVLRSVVFLKDSDLLVKTTSRYSLLGENRDLG